MVGICNICGSAKWIDMNGRVNVRCVECGSLERTRAIKLTLDRLNLPKSNSQVLHFAPEPGLSKWLQSVCPSGYNPVDFNPKLYPSVDTKNFDLVSDCDLLPDEKYDVIIHSHVVEHVPCNIAHIFYHLTRTLKADGTHIFSLPIMSGNYDEYYGPISKEDAQKRFGQFDHVRRFGREDIDRHLGIIMNIDKSCSLYNYHTKEELDLYNIPESERKGLNGSTIFVVRKDDYKLQDSRR